MTKSFPFQNVPNTRESPPKRENIFQAFSRLNQGKATLIYFCIGAICFFLLVLFFMVKGVLGLDDNGERIPLSGLADPVFLAVFAGIVLLTVWVIYTLKKVSNSSFAEQQKYYELGSVAPLSPDQQKALRLHLVEMYYHGFWVKTLEYYPCEIRVDPKIFRPQTFTIEGKSTYKAALDRDWGIVSKGQYDQLIKELFEGMHSKLFALDMEYIVRNDQYVHTSVNAEERQNIKRSNEHFMYQLSGLVNKPVSYIEACFTDKEEKPKKLIWAFDLWRVIAMSRDAFMAGYIPEEEAWQHIRKASGLIYYLFESFEDFYDNYRLGNAYWSKSLEVTSLRLRMWELYIEECDWEEQNLPWNNDRTPEIPSEMKNGFKEYIESKMKKFDAPIGFKRSEN